MPPGITFNILGDASNLSKTLHSARDDINKTGNEAGASFKRAGGVIAGALAGAGIGKFLSDSITGWQDHERVVHQSEQVIKTTGGVARVTAGDIGNLADAIERKTGVDGDAIQAGENLLATFTNIRNEAGKGNDIFNQTTQVMVDMSVALGEDSSTAAIQLGKALNDPIRGVTALTKVGVSFTKAQRDQIKAMVDAGNTAGAQKVILAELNREFGGSAAAQETASDRLQVSMRALEDSVGQGLAPVMQGLASVLSADVVPAITATTGWLKENWSWLKYVTGALVIGVAAWKAYTLAMVAGGAWRAAQAGLAGVELALGGVAGRANAAALRFVAFKEAGGLAATGIGLFAVGVGVLGFQIAKVVDKHFDRTIAGITEAFSSATAANKSWTEQLQQSNGALTDSIKLSIGKQLQDEGIAQAAGDAGISLKELVGAVTGGQGAYDALIKKWQASGVAIDSNGITLLALMVAYSGAQNNAKQLGTVVKDGATSQSIMGAATSDVTAKFKQQASAADQLKARIKSLSGSQIAAAQSSLQFQDALAQEVQAHRDAEDAVVSAQSALSQAVQSEADAETSAARQVSDAQKAVGDARQQAADEARQAAQTTVDAEHKLTQSQHDARTAQLALTQARRDARQALIDLANKTADADLAQRSADLAVQQAAANIGKVQTDPNATALDVQQAQLAYDQALQAQKEQTEATTAAHDAQDKATKAGVEGSQQVKDAKAGVAAATRAEQQAERELAADRRAQAKAAVDGAQKIAAAQQALADAQHSAAESMANAANSVADAQRSLNTAIAATSTSLHANTARGRANRQWMLSQLSTIGDLAGAQLDAGVKTSVVTQHMRENEAALRAAAIAAGFNAAEVDAMIRQFGRIPKSKTTTVNVVYNVREHIFTDGVQENTGGGSHSGVGGFRTNAQGTGYFRGRESLVGENGPEIVRLPYGSQVDPSSVTASKLGWSGGGDVHVHVNVDNVLATKDEVHRAVVTAVEEGLNRGMTMTVRSGSIRTR